MTVKEVYDYARVASEGKYQHPNAQALYQQGFCDGYFDRRKPALHDIEMIYYNAGYTDGSKIER